ncbi:MAG: hypothetical protein U1F50_21435 [Rubrivivax sp.]
MIDRRRLMLLPLIAAWPLSSRAQPAMTVIWSGFPPGGLGDQVTRPLIDKLRASGPAR